MPAPCPGLAMPAQHQGEPSRSSVWLCRAEGSWSSSELPGSKRQLWLTGKPTGRELLAVDVRISIIICSCGCQKEEGHNPSSCSASSHTAHPKNHRAPPASHHKPAGSPQTPQRCGMDLPTPARSPRALRDPSALSAPEFMEIPSPSDGWAVQTEQVHPHLGQVLA